MNTKNNHRYLLNAVIFIIIIFIAGFFIQSAMALDSVENGLLLTHLPIVFNNYSPPPPIGEPPDGSWKGEAITNGYPDQKKSITYTVENDGGRIATGARIDTYYHKTSGIFVCYGTVQWTTEVPININSDGSFHISGGLINKLTWEGNFVSPEQAEGTFHIEVLAGVCGTVVQDGTWSAEWVGGP